MIMTMRSQLVLVVMLAACAHQQAPIVPRAPSEAPARDLATAKPTIPSTTATAEQGAKDPRVVDLDIIRITASRAAETLTLRITNDGPGLAPGWQDGPMDGPRFGELRQRMPAAARRSQLLEVALERFAAEVIGAPR